MTKINLLPYVREDVLSIQDIQQKLGWEIATFNLPNTWKYTEGEGVTVAVLDTGVDLDHNDLKENLLPGINFVNPKLPPIDDNAHGTHVTGIICACNNDIGIVGVAPKTKVIPVKVLDKKGSGDLDNVCKGIYWAVDQGVDFITLSLGCPNPIKIIEKAINYAYSKGVVVFCAAGNAGKTKNIFYPANYKNCISIGSCGETYKRSSFSCTGEGLDFLCPGDKILSTVPHNWYAILSGTSMACPFAVGIAALCLSYNRKNGNIITLNNANDYRELFKKNTIDADPDDQNDKHLQGFGIINPNEFYKWA